jgi:hypothetical protein
MPLAPITESDSASKRDTNAPILDLSNVTLPLRALGLPCDVAANDTWGVVTATLPDSSFLFLSTGPLPEGTGDFWRAAHVSGSPADFHTLYDSSLEDSGCEHLTEPLLTTVLDWVLTRFPRLRNLIDLRETSWDCWCIVAHPTTAQDREAVNEAFRYARGIGDVEAFPLLLLQLTGHCNWRPIPTGRYEVRTLTLADGQPDTAHMGNPPSIWYDARDEYSTVTQQLGDEDWELLAQFSNFERPVRPLHLSLWGRSQQLRIVALAPAFHAPDTAPSRPAPAKALGHAPVAVTSMWAHTPTTGDDDK